MWARRGGYPGFTSQYNTQTHDFPNTIINLITCFKKNTTKNFPIIWKTAVSVEYCRMTLRVYIDKSIRDYIITDYMLFLMSTINLFRQSPSPHGSPLLQKLRNVCDYVRLCPYYHHWVDAEWGSCDNFMGWLNITAAGETICKHWLRASAIVR